MEKATRKTNPHRRAVREENMTCDSGEPIVLIPLILIPIEVELTLTIDLIEDRDIDIIIRIAPPRTSVQDTIYTTIDREDFEYLLLSRLYRVWDLCSFKSIFRKCPGPSSILLFGK